jgi:uncharacterized protein (TIGR00369 family)
VEDNVVKIRLRAEPHQCGYQNVMHGGITAALLDECMAWAAARVTHRVCVTGDLNIRYLKRIPLDRETMACAEVVRGSRRIAHVKATLIGDDGEEYARADGRFVPVSAEETLAVDDLLIYRGDEERVFDVLRIPRDPAQGGGT